VTFSSRTPRSLAKNRLAAALETVREPHVDLTVTNPTAVGLPVDDELLLLLADVRGARYVPDPRGLPRAREAVARWYDVRRVPARPENVVLTASSSEAYAFLFKLLCEPGDAVLVPAPSYPLLDALAELECVALRRYALDETDGFFVHAHAVEEALERTGAEGRRVRAVVLVAPNNPTGSGIRQDELEKLVALARARSFAIVSDEVFLDYRLQASRDEVTVAAGVPREALVFSLGGLSKSAGLPQLKAGWILASGPQPLVAEALERLEWIADAFLSVSTPVQLALPDLLERGRAAADAIRARVKGNARLVAAGFPAGSRVEALPFRAGWSAVLRVPAVEPEEDLVVRLLETHGVLVQPGYFFDFPREAFLVLSLLPEPAVFADGLTRLREGLSR
jgi:aspartate/methionine/tyrosine aminotransferase